MAGIRIMATGGIGGVHSRRPKNSMDISADLTELGRTPGGREFAPGAKGPSSICRGTLEVLENLRRAGGWVRHERVSGVLF